MHKPDSILDFTEPTSERLFYAIEAVSRSTDRFVIVAVLSHRVDVEGYASDDPDLVPGSMIAQQITYTQLRRELLRDVLSDAHPGLHKLLELVNGRA